MTPVVPETLSMFWFSCELLPSPEGGMAPRDEAGAAVVESTGCAAMISSEYLEQLGFSSSSHARLFSTKEIGVVKIAKSMPDDQSWQAWLDQESARTARIQLHGETKSTLGEANSYRVWRH